MHISVVFFFISILLNCVIGSAPLSSSRSHGSLWIRLRCPKKLDDCHVTGKCYRVYKICILLLDGKHCLQGPSSSDTYMKCYFSRDEASVVATLKFNLNVINQPFSLFTSFTRNYFLSGTKTFKTKLENVTLRTLPNETIPVEDSWMDLKPVNEQLINLFSLSAVVQCKKDRFGSSCMEQSFIDHEKASASSSSSPTPISSTPSSQDPCNAFFCKNHGKCRIDEASMPKCECLSGWTGEHCEKQNLCVKHFCENRGVCKEQKGRPFCSCKFGWFGSLCQFRDPCASYPCLNGGNCSLGSDRRYFCHCRKPYHGNNCEQMQQVSFMNQSLIIILVVIAFAIPSVMGLIFAIAWKCRQPKSSELHKPEAMTPRAIDDVAALRYQRVATSGNYETVNFENCYSDNISDTYEDPDRLESESPGSRRPNLPDRPVTSCDSQWNNICNL